MGKSPLVQQSGTDVNGHAYTRMVNPDKGKPAAPRTTARTASIAPLAPQTPDFGQVQTHARLTLSHNLDADECEALRAALGSGSTVGVVEGQLGVLSVKNVEETQSTISEFVSSRTEPGVIVSSEINPIQENGLDDDQMALLAWKTRPVPGGAPGATAMELHHLGLRAPGDHGDQGNYDRIHEVLQGRWGNQTGYRGEAIAEDFAQKGFFFEDVES